MIVAVIYSTAGLMFSFYKITMDINVCRDSKFLSIEINLIGLITEGGWFATQKGTLANFSYHFT